MAKAKVPSVGKKELVDMISAKMNGSVSKKDIGEIFNHLFDAIGDSLVEGSNVTIKNFATFGILTRKGGMKNVFGKMTEVAGGNYVKVTAGKGLKDKVMATYGTITRPSKSSNTEDEAVGAEVADEVVA